jgi:hypothetical protein
MRKWVGVVAWAGVAIVIVIAAVVAASVSRLGITRPTVYELSSGYRGWLVISYENLTCPRPSTRGLYQVVRVAVDGRGCTSGAMPRGWHCQRAEYMGPNGVRAVALSVWPLGHSDAREVVVVFVGTEDEFRNSPRPAHLWAR